MRYLCLEGESSTLQGKHYIERTMNRLEFFIPNINNNIPVLSFFACYLLLLTRDLKINYMNINNMTFFKPQFPPVISLVNSSDTLLLFPVIGYNSIYNECKNEYMNKQPTLGLRSFLCQDDNIMGL